MADQVDDIQKRIAKVLSLPPEKRVYFNGFVINLSASDVAIGLETNGQPAFVLNTSFAVAKALASVLNVTLSEFEKNVEYQIPELKDIEERFL